MKIVNILAALVLSTTLLLGGESDEKPTINLEELPKDVQSEVQRALQDAHKARLEYLAAIAKANEDAVKKLERQVANHTRRGNLEGALAAQNAIDAINAGWVKERIEVETDLLGNEVVTKEELILSKIVGTYRKANDKKFTLTLNKDLTYTTEGGVHFGSGKFKISDDSIVITRNDNNVSQTFSFGESFLNESGIIWDKE